MMFIVHQIESMLVVIQRILTLFPQLNGCVYFNTSEVAKYKLIYLSDIDKLDNLTLCTLIYQL